MNTEQVRADLLPCPFCGSTNIEIQISTPDREGVPTNLMCSDCGASGPWEYEQGNSHAKADAAWNTRAALQSQDKEDAERYRRLRKGDIDDVAVVRGLGAMDYGASAVIATYSYEIDGDDLDSAIDHARRIEGDGE